VISPFVRGSNPSDPTTVNLGQLLPFSENFDVVIVADKFKPFFYQLLSFFTLFAVAE